MQKTTSLQETARTVSHNVLAQIAPPDEVEVSLFYLDPLIEMADRGDVQPTDVGDHSGGFGPTDLLAVSVVPAVVHVLKALDQDSADQDSADQDSAVTQAAIEEAIRATRPDRDRLLARIGSSRAEELREQLEAAIATALCERLAPRTDG